MHSHEHGCDWVRDRLDALIDDGLDTSAEDRAALERHVAGCEACARELSLARTVQQQLRAMAFTSVSPAVIERAAAEIGAEPARVVPLRARAHWLRRLSVVAAAAAALALLAVNVVEQRRRAADALAVEQAAQDAAIAFAYVGKYARRAGAIVENEVIEERLLAPVERVMEKSGVGETKSSSSQS